MVLRLVTHALLRLIFRLMIESFGGLEVVVKVEVGESLSDLGWWSLVGITTM